MEEEKQDKLPGEDLVVDGVDQELVPVFARICRFIGLLSVLSLVIFAWTYEIDYRQTIVEKIARSGRLYGAEAVLANVIWTSLVLFFGWVLRLQIGRLIVGAFFLAFDAIKAVVRRI